MTTEFAAPDIFYSLACFAYILVGVFCGVVRWFHMCHPFDKHGDFFYPARRQVTFFFVAIVLQLPYVLCPSDNHIWFYVRSFGMIYYPVCFAMLFHRYFRLGQFSYNWHFRLVFFIPFLMLIALLCLAVSSQSFWIDCYQLECEWIMGAVSILLTIEFVREGWWLNKQIDNYHTQNYSNESDFPYKFAKKVLYQPIVWFLIMWVVFLADNRMVKMVVDLVFAVWMLRFLCMILHPNRMIRSKEMNEDMDKIEQASMDAVKKAAETFELTSGIDACNTSAVEAEETNKKAISEADWKQAKEEVLAIVSHRYLEPSLKRIEVIRDVQNSTQAVAGSFITEVGFYKLVNAFRIRHYEQLMQSGSANLSQEIVAERCGFKNRWALANARKRLEDFDYSLISEYL